MLEELQQAQLKIEKLVYGGHGIAHHENKTYFVSDVAEGELIDALIRPGKKRKGVRWAKLDKVIEANTAQRINPKCSHVLECGGCSYQHLSHNAQIEIKEKILAEIFQNEISLSPSIKSPVEFNYRNKCEFTFGEDKNGKMQLGLHPAGKFFEVLDLNECHLLPELTWNILCKIKELVSASELGAFKDLKDIGFWATITVRYSSSHDHALLIWKVKDPHEPKLMEISEKLMQEFPQIKGVMARPTPRGELVKLLGIDTLLQSVGEIDLVYGAENFFQVNTHVLPLFMNQVTEMVREINPDTLYDLFAGVGAIGLYIAKAIPSLKLVIGAESDELACKMADFNAELNSIENYKSNFLNLYKGKWSSFLKSNNSANEAAQPAFGAKTCIIVDPPRAGLTPKTIQEIITLNPADLIYVSCNPTTQKRDIDDFKKAGYKMQSLQLVDMFPQTMHLEAISHLCK